MTTAPAVSPLASACFLALVAALAVLLPWAAAVTARPPGERPATGRRWGGVAAAVVALWLGASALVASTGALRDFGGRPPGLMVFVGLTTLATTLLAFSPLGSRLVAGIGFAGLVGFQAFRVPLELLLHRLAGEGVVPVQMTFSGYNFDIVTGLLAAVVAVWALVAPPPRWVVAGWNVLGVALLVTIVTIAILSAPVPFRTFHNEPANTFVAFVPYVWLPAFLVQAAWLGHLLVFRRLVRG